MGYYSEVAITMHKEDFRDLVRRASEDSEMTFDLIRKAELFEHSHDLITMFWDNVKWYETTKSVGYIMNFIRDDREYQFKRMAKKPMILKRSTTTTIGCSMRQQIYAAILI